jgi:hypothetical protein
MLTDLLADAALRQRLRQATSSSALYKLLIEAGRSSAPGHLKTAHGS